MPAPLAKGIIIAASVIVAAGIAVYENPQIRQWVIDSRRKIALALHSLGDEIHPPSQDPDAAADPREAEELRRRRREELVRANRARLYREGVGHLNNQEKRNRKADASKSFDTLVGNDGMLRDNLNEKAGSVASVDKPSAITADSHPQEATDGLRHRTPGLRGLERGAAFASPFADEDEGQVIFDRSLIGVERDEAPSDIGGDDLVKTRESSATMTSEHPEPLVDLTISPEPTISSSHAADQQQTHQAQDLSELNSGSFYSLPNHSNHTSSFGSTSGSGTATPTEDNFSDSASLAGSGIAMDESMSLNSSVHGVHGEASDAMSDAFSDLGVHTPGSWTDVGSDAGSDDNDHSHAHPQ